MTSFKRRSSVSGSCTFTAGPRGVKPRSFVFCSESNKSLHMNKHHGPVSGLTPGGSRPSYACAAGPLFFPSTTPDIVARFNLQTSHPTLWEPLQERYPEPECRHPRNINNRNPYVTHLLLQRKGECPLGRRGPRPCQHLQLRADLRASQRPTHL